MAIKRQMQNVSFRSIEEFLDALPKEELQLVEILRKEVYQCIPEVREKLSFNVPFFAVHKSICFIWPGSVWWGSKQTIQGVQFGFTQGHRLTNIENHFEVGKRKQVIIKTYRSRKDLDLPLLRSFLFEAALIDARRD